ncbi:MAG: esterase/lipase family protein [Gammaproteobacteria bacterium]
MTENPSAQHVVCIHGLWMPGLIMTVLRRRLEDVGFNGHEFSYQSVVGNLDDNIARLRDCVDGFAGKRVHFVAHSLGGIVALQALRRNPELPVDRVVCLGSPLVDSEPARLIHKYDWGTTVIGRTVVEGVLEDPIGTWAGPQQIGAIAGTRPFGVAKFIMPLEDPNDGVVSVAETRLPGITDHIEMPVTHSGLVFSDAVAQQVVAFLSDGRFA